MIQLHVIISATIIEVKHLQPLTVDKMQFYRVYVDKTQTGVEVIQ